VRRRAATSPGRHFVRRAVWVVILAAALVGLAAAPGWAHTSLRDSTPANLSRLEAPPESIELEFTDPVDPETVTVRVLDSEGGTHEGAQRTTPAGKDTTEVAFTLPDLPEGTYGIAWQSVGRDGHRAVGEVVFGVGSVGQEQVESAQFSAVSTFDRAVDGAGATGRFLWYLGLSLAVGALFVLVWMAGEAGAWTTGGRKLWTVARFWLSRGLKLAFLGAALRLAATLVILSGSFEGSAASRVGKALSTGGTLYEALVPLALAFAIRFSERVSVAPYLGRRDRRWRNIAAAVGAAVVAGAVGGHLAVNRAPEIAVVVSSAHILAAALWIGPLCIVALWLAASRRSGLAAAERSGVLAAFFPRFARTAAWSLLVLVLTGAEALWANIGTNLLGNRYGLTLTVKLALLLVVILPLALSHDQRVKSEPETLNDPKFGRSLRIEIAGLATVLVLASALAVLNPTAGPAVAGGGGGDEGSEAPLAAPLAAAPVGDVSECSGLNVGRQNCYKTYFSALMRREDAGAAVSKILELSQADSYVATQCHQITHDLGREAADYYETLGEALSFEASACWSGYYHGVVEQRMSEYDNAELLTKVPTFCKEAAKDKYSFVHYNCVHGVGHGIMLRFDADLFESIPYCEKLTDSWELSSCVSGAFMQNVVSAQEGHTGASFRDGDLVYPCNEVGRAYRDECFGMQTSYILWKSESDLAKGFAVCDTVESDFADDCYQSMGRDISGNSLLDPVKVVEGCSLGGPALRESCIVGASLNAVFNDHNTDKANELCAIVDEVYRKACLAARDRAAASF
jgi:copper transport protein